jgi:hypothetical protein
MKEFFYINKIDLAVGVRQLNQVYVETVFIVIIIIFYFFLA